MGASGAAWDSLMHKKGAEESPAQVQADTASGLTRQQHSSSKPPGCYAEVHVTGFHSPALSMLTWVAMHLLGDVSLWFLWTPNLILCVGCVSPRSILWSL